MFDYDRKEIIRRLEDDLVMEFAKAEAECAELTEYLNGAFIKPRSIREWRAMWLAARTHHTNKERLEYYRAHGLDKCDDYPGGDSQFEADVLSGRFHDEDGEMDDPPAEDAYIIVKMLDGTFVFEESFRLYGYNNAVSRAYEKIVNDIGVDSFYRR